MDLAFMKRYKTWLLTHNTLIDCSYRLPDGKRSKMRKSELAAFRNDPTLAYVEREIEAKFPQKIYRRAFAPNYKELTEHIVHQHESTIYMINSGGFDVLLMLADLDNKNGGADINGATDYFNQRYLNGHGWAEPSTFGQGRHLFFRLHVAGIKRSLIYSMLKEYKDLIMGDKRFGGFGITLDNVFYGLPTLWKGEKGRETVLTRGNELKLPFCSRGEDDLRKLQNLPALDFQSLSSFLQTRKSTSAATTQPLTTPNISRCDKHSSICSSTPKKGQRWDTDNPNGKVRRIACCSFNMVRTNGKCTEDEVLADYHQFYNPTGMDAKDISKREKHIHWQLAQMRQSFQPVDSKSQNPHSFRKDEYLPLLKEMIPASAFIWKRRERLTPEKLADFVGIKVQDAFVPKDRHWYGATCRNSTIKNMRAMKAKGLIGWIANNHTYKRLLEIAVEYKLLKVYEKHIPPTSLISSEWYAITKKGRGRVIGPGMALVAEHARFQKVYEENRPQKIVPHRQQDQQLRRAA